MRQENLNLEGVHYAEGAKVQWVEAPVVVPPGASASSRGPVKGIQHHKTKEKNKGEVELAAQQGGADGPAGGGQKATPVPTAMR